MTPIFQFREGCHLRGDAQVVGERLESIRTKRNALTPDIVLQDARNIRSPLHEFFEWDESEAARKYRLDQAGHLIRAVQVTYEDVPAVTPRQIELTALPALTTPVRPVRAFLVIRGDDGVLGYVETQAAMSDPDMRKQVLQRAHSELDAVARKWREVSELAEVFKALDRLGDLVSTERQPG